MFTSLEFIVTQTLILPNLRTCIHTQYHSFYMHVHTGTYHPLYMYKPFVHTPVSCVYRTCIYLTYCVLLYFTRIHSYTNIDTPKPSYMYTHPFFLHACTHRYHPLYMYKPFVHTPVSCVCRTCISLIVYIHVAKYTSLSC